VSHDTNVPGAICELSGVSLMAGRQRDRRQAFRSAAAVISGTDNRFAVSMVL
jgi:hypothetical protein